MGAAAAELSPGARVDRFEIVGRLGGGGFGVVYAARHLHLAQTVALKLLRADLVASSEAVERFFREARAAASIGSPHIVEILDCGTTASGQPFISMELLEGTTLDRLVGRGSPLATNRAVDIAIQILEGLAAAHGAGITHRDLKPANVFLCREEGSGTDFVKILDFGASKVQQHALEKALTRTGMWIGTPAYMSPEQFLGARDVDHRADLYALSVVLYEMLADSLPVEASTAAEMAERVLTLPPRPLAERAPGLPAALCRVVERGLEKEPAARWSDAVSYASALREATGLGPPVVTDVAWALRQTEASGVALPAAPAPVATAGLAALEAAAGARAPVASAGAPPQPSQPSQPYQPPAAPPSGALVAQTPAPPVVAPPPLSAQAQPARPQRSPLGLVIGVALVAGMVGGGIVSGAIAVASALAGADDEEGAPSGPSAPGPGGGGVAATHNGVIAAPGQRARFPLEVTQPRSVTIQVNGVGLDPTVRVVDGAGGQLGFDDDGGGGLNSRLVLHLQPGSYFIEVAGFSNSTGTFTCTVF